MQSRKPSTAAGRFQLVLARLLPFVSGVLILYGALGVAVNLRLLSLLSEGIGAWLGGRVAWDTPTQIGWLGALEAHYDERPWLAWAAWLVGVALLALPAISVGPRGGSPSAPEDSLDRAGHAPPLQDMSVAQHSKRTAWWLAGAVLALLIVIGGVGRMVQLWPPGYGLSREPYDDEGVYAGTSQLFLQGIIPYRDYFFAHPPIAAIAYAPAMAYHFTEWGSPTSFMDARYLSVFYSLVTLALIFGIAYKLAGLWGGALAGVLWAIDGRVVEINRKIMLEGPLVLLSCAGVLLYLWVRPQLLTTDDRRPTTDGNYKLRITNYGRRSSVILALAGAVAALSALTKIAGLACLLAIVADMVWLSLENRGRRSNEKPEQPLNPSIPQSLSSQYAIKRPFLTLGLGALAAAAVVAGPFLVLAPSQFIREVLFFQLLRPSDGLVDTPARIGDITSSLANALTPMLASLGFVVLSAWAWTRRGRAGAGGMGPWRLGILWTFFSLLLFTYSRSFYQHYYIQLAAPFCLLAAGTGLFPCLLKRLSGSWRTAASRILAYALPLVLLAIVAVPLVVVQWTGMTTRDCPHCEDHIFEIVAKYVNNAVPPGSPVLSSDEQFNVLAARPPSYSPTTGYLLDSYGQMIFLGLGMDTRDWGDLIGSSLKGDHGNDPYAVMQSARPQADFLDRASHASLIVVHARGFARLSNATIRALNAAYKAVETQARYTIYRGYRGR